METYTIYLNCTDENGNPVIKSDVVTKANMDIVLPHYESIVGDYFFEFLTGRRLLVVSVDVVCNNPRPDSTERLFTSVGGVL